MIYLGSNYFISLLGLLLIMELACCLQGLRQLRHSRSPAVEVIMGLPPQFADIDSFRAFLGVKPERRRRDATSPLLRRKRETETAEHATEADATVAISRRQREASPAAEASLRPDYGSISGQQLQSGFSQQGDAMRQQRDDLPPPTMIDSQLLQVSPYRPNLEVLREFPEDAMLALAQQGPSFPLDPSQEDAAAKKRRNTSEDGHEGKRPYQDVTTARPFWKKADFVTTREGRHDDQAQHRSGENSRESHSMKDLGKSVASNEIPHLNQRDSYYAGSSNSRAYASRSSDAQLPKSAYDTFDFSRRGQGRNLDTRGRLTQDGYVRTYDRYNGYYPYGAEIQGRGVEYYHRSTDPGTGRIIYYATLPEPDVYRSTRTYSYDAYGRTVPSYPGYSGVPTYSGYPNYNPYAFSGYPGFSTPGQDYYRNARYQQTPRSAYDDPRLNKTLAYVIYDAEEKRSNSYPSTSFDNRYAPPLSYPGFSGPVTYQGYQPYQAYPYNNQYDPYSSRRNFPEQRSLVTRNVDLPLSTRVSITPTLKPVTSGTDRKF